MNKLMRIVVVVALAALAGASGAETALQREWSAFDEALERRLEVDDTEILVGQYREVVVDLWQAYQHAFRGLSKTDVQGLEDDELRAIFMSMAGGLFMIGPSLPRDAARGQPTLEATAKTMLQLLGMLAERGLATADFYRVVHTTLFGLRLWDLAAKIRDRIEYATHLPVISDETDSTTELTLWHLEDGSKRMVRHPYQLGPDMAWLVLASPGCGPSRAAAAGIEQDEALLDLFKGRSLWMMRPGSDASSFPWVGDWQREHPDFPFFVMHHLDDWPMLDLPGASPTFVRIHQGQVVGVHMGWPVKGYERVVKTRLLEIEAEAQARAVASAESHVPAP